MSNFPIPPVTELARAYGNNVDELVSWFCAYYDTDGAPFNYLTSVRCIKQSYQGFHDLRQLMSGCSIEKTAQGKKSNSDVVELAAPLSFGRRTQVFDLSRKQFPFGRDMYSGYRIPFFFVEDQVVKLYFLQPRKDYRLTYEQLCMVATIHKRYLLDTEFFGQKVDVEYVDVSASKVQKVRELNRYNLADLELWSEKRLTDRLSLVSEALEIVRNGDLVRPRRRITRPRAPDLPLFD